jgi:predicted amidophosphoribosyltransferase
MVNSVLTSGVQAVLDSEPVASCMIASSLSCERCSSPVMRPSCITRARGAVLLVPVPIHPERLASRGYNQSGLLACRLAERLGARVQLRALCRSSNTRAQAKSSKRERERNLDNQIQPRARLKGSFILVDDVLTTGATASACLGALRRGGGVPLAVLTVAIAE